MECDFIDGKNYGEYNGVGVVDIYNIFDTGRFFPVEQMIWQSRPVPWVPLNLYLIMIACELQESMAVK